MPKEVTDPDLLKDLNAGPKEADDPTAAPLAEGETVSGTTPVASPFSWSNLGNIATNVGTGVAQGGAKTAGRILDQGQAMTEGKLPIPLYGNIELPPSIGGPFGAASKFLFPQSELAAVIPQDWRDKMKEFADKPSTSTAQTAGQWAETGMELATVPGGGGAVGAGIKGIAKTGGGIAANEIAWEGAKQIGGMLGTDHIWPIFLTLKAVMGGAKRGLGFGEKAAGKVAKEAAKETAEAAPKAAVKAAAQETPAPTSPPPPEPTPLPGRPYSDPAAWAAAGKPRVRVQASSRPAP